MRSVAQTPVESCEEVRLLLARLLVALVRWGGKAAGAYAGEAVALMESLAMDPYHEVHVEACALARELVAALGLRLQPVAKQMVATLLPLATAKRHRVRVAAVQAVRAAMHQVRRCAMPATAARLLAACCLLLAAWMSRRVWVLLCCVLCAACPGGT